MGFFSHLVPRLPGFGLGKGQQVSPQMMRILQQIMQRQQSGAPGLALQDGVGSGGSLDGSYKAPAVDDHGVSYVNWMRQKQGLPPQSAEEQGWGAGILKPAVEPYQGGAVGEDGQPLPMLTGGPAKPYDGSGWAHLMGAPGAGSGAGIGPGGSTPYVGGSMKEMMFNRLRGPEDDTHAQDKSTEPVYGYGRGGFGGM